jgi:hypothetical protein
MDDFQDLHDPFQPIFLGHVLNFQRIAHVVDDIHMRPHGVGLEDHADAPFFRRHKVAFGSVAHERVSDSNGSFRRFFEACDHTQRRRLAAAGRPEERDELPVLDFDVEIAYGRDFAEAFINVIQFNGRHIAFPSAFLNWTFPFRRGGPFPLPGPGELRY